MDQDQTLFGFGYRQIFIYNKKTYETCNLATLQAQILVEKW